MFKRETSGTNANMTLSDVSVFDPRAPRTFWLDGDSVMCACPDCHAPVSIRLWLMVADCWQCGCSIELTAAQERTIQSLLRREQSAPTATSPTTSRDAAPTSDRPVPRTSAPTSPALPQTTPRERQRPLPTRQVPLPERRAKRTPTTQRLQPQPARLSFRDWLKQMPAWLISMLFHMALLALMAMFFLDGGSEEDPYITLSTEANRWRQSGGNVTLQNAEDELQYDLPMPSVDVPQNDQQRQAMAKANQVAKQLRIDPKSRVPELPSLEQVKQTLRSGDMNQRTLAARDPRVRVDVVQKEGGTTLTEAAVARGLRWLAQHQNPDGSWSLHRFSKSPLCRGQCHDHGSIRSDSAGTSLSLLPFLGAGQSHQVGIYRDTVAKGLRWLLQQQATDGDLRADSSGNAGMYAHGQGAIVLCEAFALTGDELIRDAAQRSIDFIVRSQHESQGGWRYSPGEAGDTSVLGWQLMALHSARAAQLDVPAEAFAMASLFLDSVAFEDGSQYSYQPQRRPTHVMTAEGLLCRMYLGWTKEYAALDQGVRFLAAEHMPNRDGTNFYYWYYATQVMHHYGGKPWKNWNLEMRDILVDAQITRGHESGSWDPVGGHASQGGRLYSTALAICTLEIYYRHAPIFRQLELD